MGDDELTEVERERVRKLKAEIERLRAEIARIRTRGRVRKLRAKPDVD